MFLRPLLLLLLSAMSPAFAEEPRGCDKFAWNIAQEQQLLDQPDSNGVSGAQDRNVGHAIAVKLVPFSEAQLTVAPERALKSTTSFAGSVEFKQAAQPGTHVVTLSDGAWIDVVQDGHYLKPLALL